MLFKGYDKLLICGDQISMNISDTVQELPKKDRSRTINTPIPIVFDKDKCPELPKVTMFDGYKAKVVQSSLREYCTEHIREPFFQYMRSRI